MDTKIVEERYAILKSIKNGGNKDQILMENGCSIDQSVTLHFLSNR